ncbi:MAG: lytic transglycosylase domain-containing protein [Hydrotalea sp.]|nr:lytic transglycosylase domain-containing protein [Hydrotalea sp.]
MVKKITKIFRLKNHRQPANVGLGGLARLAQTGRLSMVVALPVRRPWRALFLSLGVPAMLLLLSSPPAFAVGTTVPTILSANDQAIYKKAFQAVHNKKFDAAKNFIRTAENPILRSAVLAQIYIHPGYKTSIKELADWLTKYKDHGMADNIYRLALARRPNKKFVLTEPVAPLLPLDAMDDKSKKNFLADQADNGIIDDSHFALDPLDQQVMDLRRLVKRDKLFDAVALARKNLTADNIKNNASLLDQMFAITMSGFYFDERYSDAATLADEAVNNLKNAAIESSWWGGLAAWQEGNYERAANLFSITSQSTDPFLQSAAYFWQGRAMASQNKDDMAVKQLTYAAKNPTTFYGQIALKYLAADGKVNNKHIFTDSPKGNPRILSRLAQIPVMARGFALLNIDEPALAMLEWRYAVDRLNSSYSENLLALADDYQLHHTGLRLAIHLQKISGHYYGRALFPVLTDGDKDLKPDDAALALAVARQESHFSPHAISRSGAVGMMQMMPTTATMVSRWDSFQDLTSQYADNKRPSKYDLFNPQLNLVMGTRYLASLLALDDVDGNLIFAVASYNAGPNNMRKWVKNKKSYHGDPLLFVESIPLRETRLYVARVLANYWVYSDMLDLDNPTLTDIVNNRWPKKFIGQ